MATVLPKTRLGKRSPLGALVLTPCPTVEVLLCARMPGPEGEYINTASASGPGPQIRNRVKLYLGQKVHLNGCGREVTGGVERHKYTYNEVPTLQPELGLHGLLKLEDAWISPTAPPQNAGLSRPVSSSIDVPKSIKSLASVEMDEMMAAMVLTSLSCSPVVQNPPGRESAPASYGKECVGGELSDSSSSGYWSWDHSNSSPVPSPPITETDSSLAPPPDEGLDMEMEQVLFDEPAPRKRKNSLKVGYRCLWPSCGKALTSVVGIKRHIRAMHLGHSTESELSRREEDFYYSEIHQELGSTPLLLANQSPGPTCASPSSPTEQATLDPVPCMPKSSAPGNPQPCPLHQSAPDCFWQVRSEHSYQACPPVPVIASTISSTSCHLTPPISSLLTTQNDPIRRRSISVGEQWLQQHSISVRPQTTGRSPPRGQCASRKARGEAKKCRKMYGIEHRDQWCTACRWKKACQRFLD